MSSLRVVDSPSVASFQGNVDVLLVTATPVELAAVQALLQPLPEDQLLKTFVGSETYYLGQYGCHVAAVVRCEMGSNGPDSALAVTLSALQLWCPRAVIVL